MAEQVEQTNHAERAELVEPAPGELAQREHARGVWFGGVKVDRGTIPLYAGVLGTAFVWLLHFQLNYMLVPWVASNGHHWVIHLIALLSVLLVLAGGWLSYVEWEHLGDTPDDEAPGIVGRTRLLALVGIMSAALYVLLIIMQDLASFFYNPSWV